MSTSLQHLIPGHDLDLIKTPTNFIDIEEIIKLTHEDLPADSTEVVNQLIQVMEDQDIIIGDSNQPDQNINFTSIASILEQDDDELKVPWENEFQPRLEPVNL